jgi:ribosomal protein L28
MQLQDQLLEHMFEKVAQAESNEEGLEEAVLALKTIGNMGLPKSIERLEAIIRSSNPGKAGTKTILRTEAILALRQLRHILPQKVTAILLPIFMAKSEQPEVRIAAAYQLLQTLPARPVLDQMARSLYTERSRQVASFLYSYMSTLARSTNPCELKLARNLKYALRHGRKIAAAFKPQYSKYVHAQAYNRNYRVGAGLSFASVIGSENVIPAFAGLDFHATALGFWSKNLFGLAVVQKNADALLSAALRRTEYSDLSLDSILSRSPRSASSSLKELKNIWEQLNTVARRPRVDGAPVALTSLKLKDQEFFMLPISAASLRKLPSVQEIRRTLHQGAHFNVHKAAMLHEMEYKIPTAIGFPLIVNIRIPTVSQISGQVRIATNGGFELELNNIKPSMASSLLTQVSVWNPVVSSGAKIVATAKVCAPITAKAEVAYKSGKPELRLAFQPQSENKEIEYVKVETRPMTWTREYRFPLTAYPKAQYKTIIGEQWNRVWNMRDIATIRQTEELVEKIFGQRVRVSGLWHRSLVNAGQNSFPVCPFSGPNHISIRGEANSEQPKEYVFKVSAEMKSNSAGMSYENFEMEGESSWQSEQEQESSAMEAVIKTEVFTKGASSPRKAEMETRVSFSPSLRILKAESEMSVEPIESLNARPAKLCARGYIQYPKAANNFQQLQAKSVVAQMKTTWGFGSCQEENKVELKVAAKHSQAQKHMLESEPEFAYWQQENNEQMEAYAPIDKQQALAKAQRLYQYNVLAKYSNLHPYFKNATAKLFKAVQHYYWANTDEKVIDITNPENTIYAQLSIEPREAALFNLTLKTPISNVVMTDVALPLRMPYIASSIRPIASQIQTPGDVLENIMSPFLPECQLNSQRLRTFDDVSIRAPLSNCWTLLAKDCEDQNSPAYAVLVKKVSQNSEQKAVKIVTPGQTIQLIPAQTAYGSLKVKINGKELNQEEIRRSVQNLESVQIVQDEEQQIVKVTVAEAGLRVSADGYSVKVQASPAKKGSLCGICGHYNGESNQEFRTPAYESVSDARRFIQAHTIKDSECAYPEQLAEIDASSEELSYEPRWASKNSQNDEEIQADSWEQAKSSSASSEEWDREDSVRPQPRHIVEEVGREICVSSAKVPRCPRQAFPEAYEAEPANVAFRCISRSHPEANRLLRIVRQQAEIPAEMASVLARQEPAYSTEYSVPKRCVQN